MPCPRLELNLENGGREIKDVDALFPLVDDMKAFKENGTYYHLYGADGDEKSTMYYVRCKEPEIHLTMSDMAELTNKLLMLREADRSLFHFAVNNCPNFLGNFKTYILKSKIQLCYFPPESL